MLDLTTDHDSTSSAQLNARLLINLTRYTEPFDDIIP